MSENTPSTPPLDPSLITPKGEVKITDKNSPFFDRVFKVIEEDTEHVIALVEVGAEKVCHIFTKSQTTPLQNTAVVSTLK